MNEIYSYNYYLYITKMTLTKVNEPTKLLVPINDVLLFTDTHRDTPMKI